MKAWREQGIVVAVVTHALDRTSGGEAAERIWSARERAIRSIKTFMVWFTLAAVSIFIPVLHLFLAPILFVICILATSSVYRQKKQIFGGIATCPICNNEFSIISGYSDWPISSNCESCNRAITISRR